MSFFAPLGSLLTHLADTLEPLFGASSAAAAIVALTLCVRLALHPLARSAARGERRRAALAPRVAELKRRHKKDPERLVQAVNDLHRKEGVSPLGGILPTLAQLPFFFVLYHLFSTGSGAGDLLDHRLLDAPLDGRWADALGHGGPFGAAGLVYLGVFALVAAVAGMSYRRNRRAAAALPAPDAPGMAGLTKVMPLLSFGTLITVAVVPLAAALYVVTSTTWSAVERAFLVPVPAGPAERAEARVQQRTSAK
ncbi:membrane protein insertase YidC [Streptomyces sp. NPDC049577]|uniref:YidC/Oxa1 family membrane protein insertase n=1 Tax=Streptomyces sp. NPDC049577 TaxID=3155153 RepID=UPI00341CCDB2